MSPGLTACLTVTCCPAIIIPSAYILAWLISLPESCNCCCKILRTIQPLCLFRLHYILTFSLPYPDPHRSTFFTVQTLPACLFRPVAQQSRIGSDDPPASICSIPHSRIPKYPVYNSFIGVFSFYSLNRRGIRLCCNFSLCLGLTSNRIKKTFQRRSISSSVSSRFPDDLNQFRVLLLDLSQIPCRSCCMNSASSCTASYIENFLPESLICKMRHDQYRYSGLRRNSCRH